MPRSTHVPTLGDPERAWQAGPRTDWARERLLDGAHEAFLAKFSASAFFAELDRPSK